MGPVKIVFLLLPKVHLLDIAGAAQVFYEANALGRQQFSLYFASTDPQVDSSQGLSLLPPCGLKNLKLSKGDFVCVPGIDFKSFEAGELDLHIARAKKWMWTQKEKGVYLGSICSGALVLGKMGLLDGVDCTCHWKCSAFIRKHYPNARLLENRMYVFDKGIFTSAGMTAGIDMALSLLEKWRSPLLAAKVAQEMVINVRRANTKEQKNIFLDFENHFHADVYRAQEILSNHLEVQFTIEDLARQMNRSTRQLSRLFKEYTGQNMQAYRDKLRIAHGEQLLLHTEMSIKEIAQECGFEADRQFLRLWKLKKGTTPGAFRKEHQT